MSPGRPVNPLLLVQALVVVVALAVAWTVPARAQDYIIEKDFQHVSFGSSIKLAHDATGHYLHSHDIAYGSGSGQQSVTAFPKSDDPNSLFTVLGGFVRGPDGQEAPANMSTMRG